MIVLNKHPAFPGSVNCDSSQRPARPQRPSVRHHHLCAHRRSSSRPSHHPRRHAAVSRDSRLVASRLQHNGGRSIGSSAGCHCDPLIGRGIEETLLSAQRGKFALSLSLFCSGTMLAVGPKPCCLLLRFDGLKFHLGLTLSLLRRIHCSIVVRPTGPQTRPRSDPARAAIPCATDSEVWSFNFRS
jgi:hypothetical protein